MRNVIYPRRSRIPGQVDDVASSLPTAVPGLVLWLDAAQLTGLSDNDPVSSWTDFSGYNNHAIQSGTLRPLYKTNIINGKPVLRFDGTDDVMVTTNTMPGGSNPYGIFIVMYTNDNSQRSLIGWGNETTNQFLGFKIGATAGYLEHYWWGNDQVWNAGVNATTWYYVAALWNSTTRSTRKSGTSTSAGAASKNTGATVAKIGNASSGDTVFYGDIAEILVYDAAVSTDGITTIENYLKNKYGL